MAGRYQRVLGDRNIADERVVARPRQRHLPRPRVGQVHVATYNQPPVPDRSPGDFHSTGAPYVPRNDSRGTKPARATS